MSAGLSARLRLRNVVVRLGIVVGNVGILSVVSASAQEGTVVASIMCRIQKAANAT